MGRRANSLNRRGFAAKAKVVRVSARRARKPRLTSWLSGLKQEHLGKREIAGVSKGHQRATPSELRATLCGTAV